MLVTFTLLLVPAVVSVRFALGSGRNWLWLSGLDGYDSADALAPTIQRLDPTLSLRKVCSIINGVSVLERS